MQIEFALEERGANLAVLEVARLFCDLQHLTIFTLALADEEMHSEIDLFDSYYSKYEFMILADADFSGGHPQLSDSRLYLFEIDLHSPLKAKVGFFHKTHLAQRTLSILKAIRSIIMFDQIRQHKEVEIELLRQKVNKEKIKNAREAFNLLKDALELEKRIKDPDKRAAFEKNFASVVEPFIDERYPRITRMEIIDPTGKKH
jgi:hypothetical protein